jgi:lipid-A-disaccharide synthase
MGDSKKHIFIIAGEASGDMHAAALVTELRKIYPGMTFSGLGGISMKNAGVKIYEDLPALAVVGFWEVLKNYSRIKKIFDLILAKAVAHKPDAIILVDYPGFNIRLAKKLKSLDLKIIYYISPQIWAWKKKRVFQIKKYVDKMLVLFDFEKDFYARYGMDVTFVGHPLIDQVKPRLPKAKILTSQNLQEYKLTIGLLPGSRENEVNTLLPIMLKAAHLLLDQYPSIQFLIIQAPTIKKSLIMQHVTQCLMQYEETSNRAKTAAGTKQGKDYQPVKTFFPISTIENNNYDGINACDLCIVASGTATLETAILEKPMVVVYKTSLFTWLLAKLFIRISNIGLVNVVAKKRIVPECVQFQATPRRIAQEMANIFTDEIRIANIKSDLHKVKTSLAVGGASRKAAQEILRTLA